MTDTLRMGKIRPIATGIGFDEPALFERLYEMQADMTHFDMLDFGLIAMKLDGTVIAYNAVESRYTGFSSERAIGLNLFSDVLPCTNNYLVSGRFDEEAMLDETISYVLTIRMRPTPVRLRMLKDEDIHCQFLAIERR